MASNSNTFASFFITLVIFATTNPLVHGLTLIPGPIPSQIPLLPFPIPGPFPLPFPSFRGQSVTGNLCCTLTGTCPGPPVSGASVRLTCNIPFLRTPISVLLGQNTTDINGFFTINTASNLFGNILPSSSCIVTVHLPLNGTNCASLSTVNGTLVGILEPLFEAIPLESPTIRPFPGIVRSRVRAFIKV